MRNAARIRNQWWTTPSLRSLNADAITYGLVTISCILIAFVFLRTYGSLFATGAVLIGGIVLLATLYRVDWGFNFLMLFVLTFGQFEVPGFDTFTFRVSYFKNLKEIEYLPYISFGDVNLFELHLLLVVFIWFVKTCLQKGTNLRRVSLTLQSIMWGMWLVFSFVLGMQKGGEFLPALWECRALVYLSILSFFVPQVLQTKKDINGLVWVMIIGVTIKALEGVLRYADNGWSNVGYEALQAHEDPLFISMLIVLLFGLMLFGGNRVQRIVLVTLTPILLLGFWTGQRRAAMAAFIASLITFLIMLPWADFRRSLKVVIPLIGILMVYVAVFWNSSSSLAGPLKQIRSGMDSDDESGTGIVVKDQDYLSNLYREIEEYNLAFTIQGSPAVGIGFGTKYEQPLKLVDIPYSLRDFMAHNNIIWLFAKVGTIGFFFFWFLLNSAALKGTKLLRVLDDPYLKTVCGLIIVCIIGLMIAAYYDLHLVRYRTMIYVGTLIGVLSTLETLHKQQNSSPTASQDSTRQQTSGP